MELNAIQQVANNLLENVSKEYNYSFKNLTTYKTGGNCAVAVFPKSAEELKKTVLALKGKLDYFVLGNGSNVLASDKGYNGVIISTKNVNGITLSSNYLLADCGTKLFDVIKNMTDNSFSGLEFAVGVPATVGGAVCMNAGCYGKNVSSAVKYVVTENGTYDNSECNFDYRSSRFLSGETIIKVCFECVPDEFDEIEERIKKYKSFRHNPKGKTCGSVFKNDGYFAGKLIDDCGLKGKRIGGAYVSNEHANFILADETACSQDIYNLINEVKRCVYEKQKTLLTEELVYLGDFNGNNS